MNFKKLLAVPFMAAFITACGDSDSEDVVILDGPMSELRITHASPDAPPVNLYANGSMLAGGVDYAVSTGVTSVASDTYTVEVEGIIPTGNATVIGPVDLMLEEDMRYDVVAVNFVNTIEPYIFTAPTSFDESMVRVAVAHLTANAPAVDVHLTGPSDTLSADTVLDTIAFQESIGPAEIPAGTYRVRVTLTGQLTPIYDSGSAGIAFAAGDDYFIAAIPNTRVTDSATAKSPIALLALSDAGTTAIYNATDGADLRIVHNSADAPAVDIVVNDDFAAPLVEDLAFPDDTGDYLTVPADTYNVKVAAANTTTTVIDADLMLDNAMAYTVVALNDLANIEPLVLADNPRMVATEARLRVIHGSTLAGNVDVYVTGVGEAIDDASPAITNFAFKADSGYVPLPAGDFDVTITPTGTKTVALGPATITLEAGNIYTVIARDEAGLSGVNLKLMDAFNP